MSSITSARRGYDAALAGSDCYVVGLTKQPTPLPAGRWRSDATESDHRLLNLCHGTTLDVGCGPGRMTSALLRRAQPSLGIDVSHTAVGMARARGVPALLRDIFAPVPAEGRWSCVLLADGNIGIGGHPAELLDRAAQVLRHDGTIVLDLARPGVATRTHQLCLLVDGRRTRSFSWTVVGVDDIRPVALAAGFAVEHLAEVAGRWFARLRRWNGAQS